jgi:hypothetical protein
MLAWYVTTEDEYRGNDISRWDGHGADAQAIFGATAGLAAAALVAIAAGDARRSAALRLVGATFGVLAVLADIYAFIAFTAN